ncbi:hypothetical protein A2U01_0068483, partial [Trifolium medium]|nr:hypothetical protein [Trifolium medium]
MGQRRLTRNEMSVEGEEEKKNDD